MNYSLLRPFLFRLDPELSHNFSLKAMRLLHQIKLLKLTLKHIPPLPRKLFGLRFENPIGLAAGLDKSGDYIDVLGALGFGFIEIGTVTPKPQAGNPKPRLFRLEAEQAIINRMGFNNKGVDYLVSRLQQKKYAGVIGINIGKNATTPIENAIDDYRLCLSKVYPYASYITINISSPNTPGLRNLQTEDYLSELLRDLKVEQDRLANDHNSYVPMLVKVAPDLTSDEIVAMAKVFGDQKIDGVIATNTTVDRDQVARSPFAKETGGLSGLPLFNKATEVLAEFKKAMHAYRIPLIASGGVMNGDQAISKIEAGASLVQLYTGFIYNGPDLIASCCDALNAAAYEEIGKKCQID